MKRLKGPEAFFDYKQTIDDVHENLKEYHTARKTTILIVFDNMIADMKSNKSLSPIVTELFFRGRKLSLAFISQFYFKVPKTIRINSTHYVIMKIPKKQQISATTIKSFV